MKVTYYTSAIFPDKNFANFNDLLERVKRETLKRLEEQQKNGFEYDFNTLPIMTATEAVNYKKKSFYFRTTDQVIVKTHSWNAGKKTTVTAEYPVYYYHNGEITKVNGQYITGIAITKHEIEFEA